MTLESAKDARSLKSRILDEAKTWIRTPYHHRGCVKHVGVDCAMLLVGIAEAVGLAEKIDVESYPVDWHFHQSPKLFIKYVEQFCDRVDRAEDADIVLFYFGKDYSHGAIICEWPLLIHASMASGIVEYIDAALDPHLSRCDKLFYKVREREDV